jgi:nicotinate dehydrogenase subunit B
MHVIYHFLPDMPLRVSALRSLGAHVNVFSIESMMDELARASGQDPLAFRLAHMQDPPPAPS